MNSQEKEIDRLVKKILETQKLWLNPDNLEEDYYICKSTQAKMRMAKTLPYHKIGKYVRYYRPDIEKMFDDAKVV